MECTIENAGPYVRVYLRGRLFSKGASAIFDDIIDLTHKAGGKVMLNLEGVQAASPAGVRIIVVAARLLQAKNGRTAICGARPAVLDCLMGRAATHAFRTFATEESAAEYLLDRPSADVTKLRSAA